MRVIKLFLISVVFLFLVVTAISLLIPSHIRISKAINIHGAKDSVFSLVEDTVRWKEWHPAFMRGDSMPSIPQIHIVSRSKSDSNIIMHLQQQGKAEVVNGWQVFEHPGADSLTLQWYMDFHLKWYPWQKFGSLFYENTYGAMMEKGLDNLRLRVQR